MEVSTYWGPKELLKWVKSIITKLGQLGGVGSRTIRFGNKNEGFKRTILVKLCFCRK